MCDDGPVRRGLPERSGFGTVTKLLRWPDELLHRSHVSCCVNRRSIEWLQSVHDWLDDASFAVRDWPAPRTDAGVLDGLLASNGTRQPG